MLDVDAVAVGQAAVAVGLAVATADGVHLEQGADHGALGAVALVVALAVRLVAEVALRALGVGLARGRRRLALALGLDVDPGRGSPAVVAVGVAVAAADGVPEIGADLRPRLALPLAPAFAHGLGAVLLRPALRIGSAALAVPRRLG